MVDNRNGRTVEWMARRGSADETQHLGVMMPTWIGDACMATPTLRALRASYPTAKITGIMRPVVHDVVQDAWGTHLPWFDDVVFCEKGSKRSDTHSRWGLTRELRARSIDAMILLTNSLWSAGVARMAGIRTIVGYDRDGRGWLLSDRVPVPREGKHYKPISAVDYYLRLAHWVGCDASNKQMQLTVRQDDQVLRQQLWQQVGLDEDCPTIVINSNAATDKLRIWPVEKVGELAMRLATEHGYQVMLHCGPREREAANRLASEANHPRIASMGVAPELPVGLSKAVLAEAALVVSSDSGPRHIAVALDRNVVSLFGATNVEWTKTYNQPEVTIAESCMANIEVQTVLAAIQNSVKNWCTGNRSAA